jgi:Fic family protein
MDVQNDAPRVTKAMTFKAGKVALSRNYESGAIRDDLVRFESLFGALSALPILPNIAAKLDADLIRRSIFGTAAIEGNPLSEERVGEILAEPQPAAGLRERAEQEIVNLGQAYARFAAVPTDKSRAPLVVSEDAIREMNRIITAHIDHEHHSPGQYRNIRVEVGAGAHGGKYTPPKALADIKTLMASFIEWLNSDEMLAEGPLVRAFLAHYHLGLIHPFGDGNGRTARLLEAAILTQSGYRFVPQTLSNFYYRNIDDYYAAFRLAEKADGHDVTPFLSFCFRMLTLSIEDIQTRIHWHIRILALQSLYAAYLKDKSITQRQHDLLHILLKHPGKTVTLRDLLRDQQFASLYRTVSEKTARRDLAKLEALEFLRPREGQLTLNYFVLD